MYKIVGIAAAAAMSVALPQLAMAQNPSQNQQNPPQAHSASSIRAQVKQNLAQAGFTDIKIMPDSFLVRAKDKSGNPVMMVINPDSITAVTAFDTGRQHSTADQNDQMASSDNRDQTAGKSAQMNRSEPTQDVEGEKIPGRPHGMVAELKQDESGIIKLDASERSEIWRAVASQSNRERAPAGFQAKIGEAVPNSLQLKPLPNSVSSRVPAVQSYQYAMVHSQLLIVNPSTKKIVGIITE